MSGEGLSDLRWAMALFDATDGLTLEAVADALRDEAFTFDMDARRGLAELLCPLDKGARYEARMHDKKPGRDNNDMRNLHLYRDVESYRCQHGVSGVPNDEMHRIGKQYGLISMATIRSALKAGKEIAARIALGEDIDPDEGEV